MHTLSINGLRSCGSGSGLLYCQAWSNRHECASGSGCTLIRIVAEQCPANTVKTHIVQRDPSMQTWSSLLLDGLLHHERTNMGRYIVACSLECVGHLCETMFLDYDMVWVELLNASGCQFIHRLVLILSCGVGALIITSPRVFFTVATCRCIPVLPASSWFELLGALLLEQT